MASPIFHLKLIPTLTLSNPTPSPSSVPAPSPPSWALHQARHLRAVPTRPPRTAGPGRWRLQHGAGATKCFHPHTTPLLSTSHELGTPQSGSKSKTQSSSSCGSSIFNRIFHCKPSIWVPPWLWKPGDLAPVTPRLAVVVFQGILQLLPRLVEVSVLGGEASGRSNHARIYSKYITV